jgi:hypothetical protein
MCHTFISFMTITGGFLFPGGSHSPTNYCLATYMVYEMEYIWISIPLLYYYILYYDKQRHDYEKAKI